MIYDSREDTLEHKDKVRKYTKLCAKNLIYRGIVHDDSKLSPPEKEIFDEYTPKLKNCTYGSLSYHTFLNEMKVALDHHYKVNDHHPEYFKSFKLRDKKGTPMYKGLEGMNLIQLTEMLCDWYASTLRNNGNILDSIDINQERFGYSDELKIILKNTALWLMEKDGVI